MPVCSGFYTFDIMRVRIMIVIILMGIIRYIHIVALKGVEKSIEKSIEFCRKYRGFNRSVHCNSKGMAVISAFPSKGNYGI